MTTETRVGAAFWPTEAEQAAPGFKVVASCSKGDIDAGIYTLDEERGWYFLTWQDGVANSWREKYSQLSTALARLALIAFCGESDWELFAADNEEADFLAKAKPFLQSAVA